MYIKPGYGFWYTDRYPIGGDFGRAPRHDSGLSCVLIRKLEKPFKGVDIEVRLDNGRIAAVNQTHCIE